MQYTTQMQYLQALAEEGGSPLWLTNMAQTPSLTAC